MCYTWIIKEMEDEVMKTWRVWYHYWENGHIKENVVYIEADDYDEAITKARKLDDKYCAGQVVSK